MSRILDTFTNLTQQHKTINLQNHTDVGPPNNQPTKHFYLMDIMTLNITDKLHKQVSEIETQILKPTAVQPALTAEHVANKRITVKDKDSRERQAGGRQLGGGLK